MAWRPPSTGNQYQNMTVATSADKPGMGRVHKLKSDSDVEDLGKKTRGTSKSIPYGIDLDLDDAWSPQNNRFRQSKHVPNEKRNQVNLLGSIRTSRNAASIQFILV